MSVRQLRWLVRLFPVLRRVPLQELVRSVTKMEQIRSFLSPSIPNPTFSADISLIPTEHWTGAISLSI